VTSRCERPGCGGTFEVAYGFDPGKRTIWFDYPAAAAATTTTGRLCRRHAFAMVPPRGWVLEDRRAEDSQLFPLFPFDGESPAEPIVPRTRRPTVPHGDQLTLDTPLVEPAAVETHIAQVDSAAQALPPPGVSGLSHVWRPTFDSDDDAGGVLRASSPLLARAFRLKKES
jgi:hypothetical protein